MVVCTKGGWWTQGSKACNSGAEQQWCRVSTFGAKYLWCRVSTFWCKVPLVQSSNGAKHAEQGWSRVEALVAPLCIRHRPGRGLNGALAS